MDEQLSAAGGRLVYNQIIDSITKTEAKMAEDKYKAVWVSHSSIGDFLKCPRAYYLNNIYRNPKTNHKITLMKPALALGQAVHNTLEALLELPVSERLALPLSDRFETAWQQVSGKLGGFTSKTEEKEYKKRGQKMINRVIADPGPISRKAIKINQDLPHYWLSKEENIILCGRIDWLEYCADDNTVNIIDFKTGKNEEDESSLQLFIYSLLVKNCQSREAKKAYYWYLDRDDGLIEKPLPSAADSENRIMHVAKKIKALRASGEYLCRKGGCFACRDLEKIAAGQAEFVGVGEFQKDIFILK